MRPNSSQQSTRIDPQNLERKGHNPQAVGGYAPWNVKESRVFHWCYDPTIRKQMVINNAFGISRLVSKKKFS
jgi:hypothetical protein